MGKRMCKLAFIRAEMQRSLIIIPGLPSVETRPKSKIPFYNPESNYGAAPAKATTKAGKFLMWIISFRKQQQQQQQPQHYQQQQQQRRSYN